MVRLAPSWKLRTSGAWMQERVILRAQERMSLRSIMGELNDEDFFTITSSDVFRIIHEPAAQQQGAVGGQGQHQEEANRRENGRSPLQEASAHPYAQLG